MNKTKIAFFIVVTLVVTVVSSCSKILNNSKADPNAQQHNEDLNNTKSESESLNTDIINVLKDVKGFGKTDVPDAITICGASVDTSQQYATIPTVLINFDGSTVCGNPPRKRAGQVKVELIQGTKWSDAGAKLRVTHINYKITFINLNNHYLTYNGVKYLTNLDGFDYIGYYFTGKLTARVKERSENITVTFENGETESWNFARLSTWEITNYTTITATVNGDSINGNKVIDSWGTTRFGTAFTTEMITPWKSGTACGWLRPTQGKYTSTTDNFTISATCGVDKNGNQVSSGCNAYGYKIEWDYKNGTAKGDAVIQYF